MAEEWTESIGSQSIAVICSSLVCIVMAAIFLALCQINHDLLYAGIAFGVLGMTIGICYVVYRFKANGDAEKRRCCKCTKCGDACIRLALCLPGSEGRATRRASRRQLAQLRMRACVQDMINTGSEFRFLEREIRRLSAEYTRLEPLAVDREFMRQDLNRVQNDYLLLSQWIEGARVPTWEDIEKMKSRLVVVAARLAAEANRQSDIAETSTTYSIAYPNVLFSRTAETIFGLDSHPTHTDSTAELLPPPPYQEIDPLSASAGPTSTSGTTFPESSLFRLPAYLAGSQESLAPPADETNAPPSYEDATSTPV